MIATYRLSDSKWAASFEFFYWLIRVQEQGVTKVVFDTANPKCLKFDYAEVMRRFHSILEPGPALAGLPYRRGTDKTQVNVIGRTADWYNSGKRFKRLQTVRPPVKCDYTITIRKNAVTPKGADSNLDAWSRFAEEIGAIVIEDYYSKPIHLHDRFALYAGAKMNFGVACGPMAVLSLTEYPMTMFVHSPKARAGNIRNGFPEDTKFPWMLKSQHMIWQDDTYDNLRRWFDQWVQATTSSQPALHAG